MEKTAQSVGEQHPTELAENLREQKKKLERLGVIAVSIFGLGVISFFLYMVGYKVMSLFAQGRILAALGLIVLVAVLGCGLLSVILLPKRRKSKKLQPSVGYLRLKICQKPHPQQNFCQKTLSNHCQA